jgi:hypothetical protein
LYSLPDIVRALKSRKKRELGHTPHGVSEKPVQNFGWKASRKETLGRPRHRWEDIKMDLT